MIQKTLSYEEGLGEIEVATLRLVDGRRRRPTLRQEVDRRLRSPKKLTPEQMIERANRELLQQRCAF